MNTEKEVKINGFDGIFKFHPLDTTKGIALNRKIERMFSDAIRMLEEVKSPLIKLITGDVATDSNEDELSDILKDIDINAVVDVIQKIHNQMTDDEFYNFVRQILSRTQYVAQGLGAIELADNKDFDRVFGSNIGGIYPVVVAAIKAYNFTPFVLLSLGKKAIKISG